MIKVYVAASSDNDETYDDRINVTVIGNNNKRWFRDSDSTNVYCTRYVGVTPNKQYAVTAQCSTRQGSTCSIDRFYIQYSPEINKQIPTVTDY